MEPSANEEMTQSALGLKAVGGGVREEEMRERLGRGEGGRDEKAGEKEAQGVTRKKGGERDEGAGEKEARCVGAGGAEGRCLHVVGKGTRRESVGLRGCGGR